MLASAAPLHPPQSLMCADPATFDGFDLHAELMRLLWSAAVVLAVVLYLGHIAAR
jgi:hypothetical protein